MEEYSFQELSTQSMFQMSAHAQLIQFLSHRDLG